MNYTRMPIEIESPEMMGYQNLRHNLTESSVFDANLSEIHIQLNDLILCYGHHIGKPELRALIAQSSASSLHENDILLTAGAATALFIVNTSLLDAGDEVIVMHPNYGTNIETPRAMNCNVKLWTLDITDGFRPNLDRLQELISSKTKLISITTPHNPTGMCIREEEMNHILNIAEKHGLYVLVDETYREIPLGRKRDVAASLSDRVISVSSLSKAYGLPGIRLGWIITQNKQLQEKFLAAKEQIQICNSVVDEEIAYQFLVRNDTYMERVKSHVNTNFDYLKRWLQDQTSFDYVLPEGGCVFFPKLIDSINPDTFYHTLNTEYGTFVGNGHWFEMDKRFMRIGFGWPTFDEFKSGLLNIQHSVLKQ